MNSEIQAELIDAVYNGVDSEPLTYTPATGTARPVQALVGYGVSLLDGHTRIAGVEISILNHATLGVSSSSLNVGADAFTVAERPGMTPAQRYINRVVRMDALEIVMELR